MKEFKTLTEYQILYLAKEALSKRIEVTENGKSRRFNSLLKMYSEQYEEIEDRMVEIRMGGNEK